MTKPKSEMTKQIPIDAAKRFAEEQKCSEVIIIARDFNGDSHVVTYGQTETDCALAAEAGNNIKRIMGWPEKLCKTAPVRIKKAAKELNKWKDKPGE